MTKPISPLRQRMLGDMAMRNMSPNTQKVYTSAIAAFVRYPRQSPDKLGIEHIRDYRLHLLALGLKARSINPIVGALRFFYGTTLGNKALAEQIPFGRVEDTLPVVLTRDQVLQLLKAEQDMMMRTIFITIYAVVTSLAAGEHPDLGSTQGYLCRSTSHYNSVTYRRKPSRCSCL